jgi:O-acetyl-ADP-ribose deacetylase (regulator of RNase III)
VYGYPPELAAAVAVRTLHEELAGDEGIDVTLCCFSEAMRAVFQRMLDRRGAS